jgi:ADP-ribose pyrophosphatase
MIEKREVVLKAGRFDVVRLTYRSADGAAHTREVARHPGAVTILPILDDGRVCLIRNYRVAVDQTLIELPAGTLEPGEAPSTTAARELEEETGYRATQVRELCEFFMSPGILSERMVLFLATGLTPGPTRLEGGELIEPCVVPWEEAMALVERGEVRDAKSLVGLLWYDRHRSRIR